MWNSKKRRFTPLRDNYESIYVDFPPFGMGKFGSRSKNMESIAPIVDRTGQVQYFGDCGRTAAQSFPPPGQRLG